MGERGDRLAFMIAKSNSLPLPDNLIISDIGMPDEDGYAFLEGVGSLSDRNKRSIPAIALTAFTRPQAQARSHRAGFDLHIAKPVQPRTLSKAAANLAIGKNGSAPAAR